MARRDDVTGRGRPSSTRSDGPRVPKRASVYRGNELAGTIERSETGSLFRYDDAFLGSGARGIAHNLPLASRAFETEGLGLHTFFAGLLPEGSRFAALVRRTKASPDDMLTLLLAAGSDTVGDVSVVPEGTTP